MILEYFGTYEVYISTNYFTMSDYEPSPYPFSVGNEHIWCEHCGVTPCRNINFTTELATSLWFPSFLFNHNFEFRAELGILDDPDEVDDLLADDADDSSDIASPIRYVKRIRFQVYKHYASEHNLPWGANNYEDLPHCIVAWTRY